MDDFELYEKIANAKVKILGPLLKVLTALKVTPNAITALGVIGAASLLYTLSVKPILGIIVFIIAACLDFLDGALARYQKRASDRGKFIDMIADSLVFTLFVIAMIAYNYVPPLPAAILIYVMLFNKVLRSVKNGIGAKTDWHFTTKAGFLPNLVVWLTYTTFFFSQNTAGIIMYVLTALLLVDNIRQYRIILKK